MVSENATASGTDSVKPTVNGLGPRDVPNGVDVANGAELRFVMLSVLSCRNGSGVCRPAGRAVAYNIVKQSTVNVYMHLYSHLHNCVSTMYVYCFNFRHCICHILLNITWWLCSVTVKMLDIGSKCHPFNSGRVTIKWLPLGWDYGWMPSVDK